uniref:CD209 antigen-like protein A n=1 Tax=Oreochromis niloticus TaxID=8128 RepID=I3K3T8_ORENI
MKPQPMRSKRCNPFCCAQIFLSFTIAECSMLICNISYSMFLPDKTCPAGWSMFSHSCYLLSGRSGSWHSARKNCIDQGADLVVIDSPEEQNFIASFTEERTWIGLNDIEQEGTWKWVDGTPLTLQYWASGQPDNHHLREDCLNLFENSAVTILM